jgi:hypothetical protein
VLKKLKLKTPIETYASQFCALLCKKKLESSSSKVSKRAFKLVEINLTGIQNQVK